MFFYRLTLTSPLVLVMVSTTRLVTFLAVLSSGLEKTHIFIHSTEESRSWVSSNIMRDNSSLLMSSIALL